MPNYGLSINSTFTPFTIQELLTPVMSATNSLREVEDAYGKQQSEADQLEYIANLLEQEGSEASLAAAQKYRNYQDVVRQGTEELMSTGNISKGRKTLWNATRQYATDVLPMKAGYEALATDIKTQASTPGIAYKKKVNYNDLPSYIADPMGISLSQGAVDLKDIEKFSSDLFEMYSNAMEYQLFPNEIDAYTHVLETQYGLTPEEATEFLQNPDGNSAYATIRELAKTRSGADESWDDWKRIDASINSGIRSAVAKRTMQTLDDFESRQNYKASQKGSNEDPYNSIFISGRGYMSTSGKESEYLNTLKGLFAGKDATGVRADVFGKKGEADVLKLYEEYQKQDHGIEYKYIKPVEERLFPEILQKTRFEFAKKNNYLGRDAEGNLTVINDQMLKPFEGMLKSEATSKAREIATEEAFKTKYGVDRVLTKDEYNVLKDIGYKHNPKGTHKSQDLIDLLDATSTYRQSYSTRMSNYKQPTNWIKSGLNRLDDLKGGSGIVYKLNADGTQGDGVKIKELPLEDKDEASDIRYSNLTKDNFIVEFNNNGKEYIIPLEILGTEVKRRINYLENIPIDPTGKNGPKDETDRATLITMELASILNDYNPTSSETSSKAKQ